MDSIKKVWQEIVRRLEGLYGKREAQSIAYLLLEDVFGYSKADVVLAKEGELNEKQLENYVRRLLESEPIQYVTGVADFYGRKFKIRSGALIPRPETEELVRLILDESVSTKPRILDVGVGSGCIAVTLAVELGLKVYGTDVSDEAIAITKENAQVLKADLEVSRHDVVDDSLPYRDLDVLVSNPPYIPSSERANMMRNVLDYEPESALFVPDEDPLLFYRRIAEEGKKCLKAGGRLFFEIHESFGKEVTEMLNEFHYLDVIIHPDMQGKDRMISAINSTSKLL